METTVPWFTTLAQDAGGSDVAGMPGQSGTPQQAPPPTGGGGTQSPPSMLNFMLPLLAVFVIMILISSMGGRKEKRRRADLMANLKKNDKVQTMGGIIGVIAEIRGDEIILRVDDATNTRIKFARSAIQAVLRDSGPQPNGSVEAKPATQGAST